MADKRIEPGPLATSVAQSIRRAREARGVTYAELADRLTKIGRPIPVLGLSRIERGDRRVDIDDLAAIARALRLPPILLAFPFDQVATVDVLPGSTAPAWEAAQWFTGRAPFPGWHRRDGGDGAAVLVVSHEDLDAYEQGAAPVHLWEEHERAVTRWRVRVHELKMLHAERSEDEQRAAKYEIAAEVENLRSVRQQMRRHGVRLPDLPAALRPVVDTYTSRLHQTVAEHYQESRDAATED